MRRSLLSALVGRWVWGPSSVIPFFLHSRVQNPEASPWRLLPSRCSASWRKFFQLRGFFNDQQSASHPEPWRSSSYNSYLPNFEFLLVLFLHPILISCLRVFVLQDPQVTGSTEKSLPCHGNHTGSLPSWVKVFIRDDLQQSDFSIGEIFTGGLYSF